MSTNRDQQIEQSMSIMLSALKDIAASHDCDYVLDGDRPVPCPCPKCTAQAAIAALTDWRYIGASPERLKTNARERKIILAWKEIANDRTLALLLSSKPNDENAPLPSPRDWYVATTVVQWLATNVGMEVLRKAGFEYKGSNE